MKKMTYQHPEINPDQDNINSILNQFKKKSLNTKTSKSSFITKSTDIMSLTGSKFNCSKNYDDLD